MAVKLKAKLGISPICWWNDDLVALSDDVSLEECFAQTREAGFTGLEMGRRFPRDAAILGPMLKSNRVGICGGWHSGKLVDGDIEAEKVSIRAQMDLFKAVGAPCIVYGEIARSIQGDRGKPLAGKPKLSEAEIKVYGAKLSKFADWCAGEGMPLSYHHHMAAVIETEPELDLLMTHSSVPLCFDAGHLAFAGGDVLRAIDKHFARITHVHVKDVRMGVIAALDRGRESFLDAVMKGAFTVPGDGSLDFEAIVKRLAGHGYQGWFVVEAEQDPKKAPPKVMNAIGQKELLRVMAAAGYEVVG